MALNPSNSSSLEQLALKGLIQLYLSLLKMLPHYLVKLLCIAMILSSVQLLL